MADCMAIRLRRYSDFLEKGITSPVFLSFAFISCKMPISSS
jgi:hypothetical protein